MRSCTIPFHLRIHFTVCKKVRAACICTRVHVHASINSEQTHSTHIARQCATKVLVARAYIETRALFVDFLALARLPVSVCTPLLTQVNCKRTFCVAIAFVAVVEAPSNETAFQYHTY